MEKKDSKITGLLALAVFALFAFCVLGVLLTGAKAYEAVVRRGEQAHGFRTAAQYLATRVRQADTAAGITVETFGGESALALRQQIDGEPYITRVYCHEGYLRELFTAEAGTFSPEDGERLLEMTALAFEQQEDQLTARFVLPDGTAQSLCWHLRSEVQP